jgi:hypothetical protein
MQIAYQSIDRLIPIARPGLRHLAMIVAKSGSSTILVSESDAPDAAQPPPSTPWAAVPAPVRSSLDRSCPRWMPCRPACSRPTVRGGSHRAHTQDVVDERSSVHASGCDWIDNSKDSRCVTPPPMLLGSVKVRGFKSWLSTVDVWLLQLSRSLLNIYFGRLTHNVARSETKGLFCAETPPAQNIR